ncbi:MAG: O-antigen ligase family protein [Rhodothermia bacterium]
MSSASVTAHRLGWFYPYTILRGSLVASVLIVLAMTAFLPWAIAYVPVVLLGAIGGWYLFSRPDLNLFVVLGSFVFVAQFDEGIDPVEVAYALFYTGYLGQWFFRRIILSDEPLIHSTLDRLIVVLLALVTVYGGIGLAFGAPASAVVVEIQSWTMLLFYFPVKETIERRDNGLKWLLITLTWLGIVVVLRNVWQLGQLLLEMTSIWQITIQGRVVANELIMIVPGFLFLVLAIEAPRRWVRIGFFALFLTMSFGLMMTQGRGNWLGFAFGLVILFLVSDGRMRRSMLMWASLAVAGSLALIFLLFQEHAIIIVSGLINRVLSIGSATSRDLSFLSRIIEWEAVLGDIKNNPILGYGMGVSISYFDITRSVTMERPWIHNGYLGVWFKYGIAGLGLLLGMTFLSIRTAYVVTRRAGTERLVRATAYAAVAGLSSIFVLAIPTNVWQQSDTILMITIMIAMASGCHARSSA